MKYVLDSELSPLAKKMERGAFIVSKIIEVLLVAEAVSVAVYLVFFHH